MKLFRKPALAFHALVSIALFGFASGCSNAPLPARAAEPAAEIKNGQPLTPEQIKARDAYIARAAAKKLQREQDELRRAQAKVYAAQLNAQAFQWQQAARNRPAQTAPRATRTNPFTSNAELESVINRPAPAQDQRPAVVSGWNGSAPTGEVQTNIESVHRGASVGAQDPEVYVPPAAYQNLPPGTSGTRVFRPEYGSNGSSYAYRSPGQPRFFRANGGNSSGYNGGLGSYGGAFLPAGGSGFGGSRRSSGSSRRGPDGAPYNVNVRSHTKRDGTNVRAHTRRSPIR